METNSKTAPITPEKDRNAVSLDLMHRMKLHGMAAAFTESLSSTFAETMTPDSWTTALPLQSNGSSVQHPSAIRLIQRRLTIQ